MPGRRGDRDIADYCDGVGNDCPADTYEAATTVCRPWVGLCDVPETCPGDGPDCPADAYYPGNPVCRPSAGPCDIDEICPGDAPYCPADEVLDGVPCPDGDLCNGDELCEVGVCVDGTPLACDDADACTTDSCEFAGSASR